MIHSAAKDVKSFRNSASEPIIRLVKFRGTLYRHLPSYLRIPLYNAVLANLKQFTRQLAEQSEDDFIMQLHSDPDFIEGAQHLHKIPAIEEMLQGEVDVTNANYQEIMRKKELQEVIHLLVRLIEPKLRP